MSSWDGDAINEYFIKKSEGINEDHFEIKKPRSVQFNRMRIVDHTLKDLYYDCASYAWKKETLLDTLDRFINKELPSADGFNYSDYDIDFRYSLLYIETQKNEALRIKDVIIDHNEK